MAMELAAGDAETGGDVAGSVAGRDGFKGALPTAAKGEWVPFFREGGGMGL